MHTSNEIASIRKITLIGLVMNVFLTGIKFVSGYAGHSSALIADAVHSLSDIVTDGAVLIGTRYWSQPADDDHPYGHAKVETLITLFVGSALLVVAFKLMYGALCSLLHLLDDEPTLTPTWFPLMAALISIAFKEYLYWITLRTGIRVKSSAVIANAWHHRSDAMSSIPAAAAVAGCMMFGERYVFLDTVGTIIVSMMLAYASWQIIKPTFVSLLDAGATPRQREEIAKTIRSFTDVIDLHKLRTRHICSNTLAIDVHIQVKPTLTVTEAHDLSHEIQNRLKESRNIIDVFVHVEPYYG